MTTTVDPDNTLTEPELRLYARRQALKDYRIVETAEGFGLRVHLTWHNEDLYLVTHQKRTQPKLFKNIRPLLSMIRACAPGISSIVMELEPASIKPTGRRGRKPKAVGKPESEPAPIKPAGRRGRKPKDTGEEPG